ncbi:MAG: DUF952 domain-containing protein [Nocardioides sp.]|uniref:DUF952 domain-containing protein n=1 Tax=Nocardioides sp. TaxID=35761 RepID=UPI0039E264DD
MRIYHIATAADWAEARRTTTYATSTLGRSLAEEGFIHASRREQVSAAFEAFYRPVREPLVLLTIDTDKLSAPWREDPVGDQSFPHIYGPLNTSAVISVEPLDRRGRPEPFTKAFLSEMLLRIGLALAAMTLSVIGSTIGHQLSPELGGLIGALLGLAVGAAVFWWVLRRRSRGRDELAQR